MIPFSCGHTPLNPEVRDRVGVRKVHQFRDSKTYPNNFCDKDLPNFQVNFLLRFASKPLLYWAVLSNCSEFFGDVRAILWLWGPFLTLDRCS